MLRTLAVDDLTSIKPNPQRDPSRALLSKRACEEARELGSHARNVSFHQAATDRKRTLQWVDAQR